MIINEFCKDNVNSQKYSSEFKINEASGVKPNGREVYSKDFYKDWSKFQFRYKANGIEIRPLPMYGDVVKGFGLDWSGIGSVGIDEAQDFIKVLNAACEVVEMLDKKYVGVTLVYD